MIFYDGICHQMLHTDSELMKLLVAELKLIICGPQTSASAHHDLGRTWFV